MAAYGGSQARGWIRAIATATAMPDLSHTATYTTAHGNPRSLTYWVRPGIETVPSWMPVRFVSAEPRWELQSNHFWLSLWSSFFRQFFLFLSFFFLILYFCSGRLSHLLHFSPQSFLCRQRDPFQNVNWITPLFSSKSFNAFLSPLGYNPASLLRPRGPIMICPLCKFSHLISLHILLVLFCSSYFAFHGVSWTLPNSLLVQGSGLAVLCIERAFFRSSQGSFLQFTQVSA